MHKAIQAIKTNGVLMLALCLEGSTFPHRKDPSLCCLSTDHPPPHTHTHTHTHTHNTYDDFKSPISLLLKVPEI